MSSDDDDKLKGHGPLKYWLNYLVWGVKGKWIVLAVAILGFICGLAL